MKLIQFFVATKRKKKYFLDSNVALLMFCCSNNFNLPINTGGENICKFCYLSFFKSSDIIDKGINENLYEAKHNLPQH